MKTLALIIGTLLAVCVLTVAAFAIVFYMEAKEEEFSRASVQLDPLHQRTITVHEQLA